MLFAGSGRHSWLWTKATTIRNLSSNQYSDPIYMETFASPLGLQSIFGWPSGPATNPLRSEATYELLEYIIKTLYT